MHHLNVVFSEACSPDSLKRAKCAQKIMLTTIDGEDLTTEVQKVYETEYPVLFPILSSDHVAARAAFPWIKDLLCTIYNNIKDQVLTEQFITDFPRGLTQAQAVNRMNYKLSGLVASMREDNDDQFDMDQQDGVMMIVFTKGVQFSLL